MKTLWPDVFVTENNITQRIHEIRSALGPQVHQILRTRHRRGYMFAPATVTVVTGEPEIARPDADEYPTHEAGTSTDVH